MPARSIAMAQTGRAAICSSVRRSKRGGTDRPLRRSRGRHAAPGTSIVTSSTRQPTAAARSSSASQIAGSVGVYSWNQRHSPASSAARSIEVVATVLRQNGMFARPAASARYSATRGQIRPPRPTGATPNGAS